MSVFSMAASNPAAPTYPLQRSVRLRSSASAYFNRTTTTPTSGSIFTHSFWVKRGILGSQSTLISGARPTNFDRIYFSATDTLVYQWNDGTSNLLFLETTQVFRDPSAWYHIIVATDTPQATNTNRVKIYVNGVQVTAFSTATYPTQNSTSYLNINAGTLNLGRTSTAVSYLDGYLEEINFIDGQALTPSSFGAYNSYGVWSPAKYTGSYGTNGFYLSFQDNSALTTTANVGIGADSSGNGNYWTSNNISLTAGVTYDSMVDVPTNTSPTNANYATLNPLARLFGTPTTADGNLRTTAVGAVTSATILFPSTGKWYLEGTVSGLSTAITIGICNTSPSRTIEISYQNNGNKNTGGSATGYGATYTTNDVIGMAVDCDAQTVTFYKNNTSQGALAFSLSSLSVNDIVAQFYTQSGSDAWVANFGQRPFTYTPPTGFNRLNTYNLPDSIVPVGAQYMAATTYTGTGAARSVVNTVNGTSFQPDFVWVKCRSTGYSNALFDSVRGANKTLGSNNTAAEISPSASGGVSSFGSNGFSLQIGTADWNQVNTNADTYVGWQWRASNASAVTNTAGTITSSVSANQTAGFSIVTYTGTGANATVGHGLGVAPRMMIIKRRNSTSNWPVYHASISGSPDNFLYLNSTSAVINAGVVFNGVTPNSTTFGVGTDAIVNASGGTYVGYMFAAVPGYSAFGSYTGNGSADGPFVYCGFRPRWVMVKSTGVDGWVILDTSRDTYNLALAQLIPNLANAEDTTNNYFRCDILSNGFKLRTASSPSNSNAVNYIYAAFAENPFKNSLAR